MSEATTRAILKAVLDTVSNIGTVHDFQRLSTEYSTFLNFFKASVGGTDYIRGWTIQLQGWPETEYLDEDFESGVKQVIRTYTYKIRGYFGVDDSAASEKTAAGLVEDVTEALDFADTIHGEDDYWGPVPPSTLDLFEPRRFGGALCHVAEITQKLKEIVALTS